MSTGPKDAKAIFLAAIEKETSQERSDFLDEACAGDAELRLRVDELLTSFEQANSFLEDKPAVAFSPTVSHQPITEKPGTVIGPYKLLQKIGEGGFGVVYMADQTEPVKRRVALKIIKPGMDTRQVIARFEAERQALAMMDHPNIAKVLDAGTTESGRPYFVMELVNGIPITQYCDEQHLTPRERLDLFIPICQAVQHAHQKGIIHRDLKPSNVLVALYDSQAVPKVIDFGVAKATGQTLTEKTMFTQLGQIVGTLEYMSPEQAQRNQLDIDTRSDIYSLGVLLYELLTGETPFDRQRLRSAAFDELLRIIREEEPPKPSLRLSTSESLPSIAANRQIEPKRLSTLVRGELDWIVMKALEKDRARRYETANGFANDIERYLKDEPVVACPPSAAYRFRKFARRNKAALSTAAVVAAALVLGVVGTSWQAILATRAEQRAVAERNRALNAEQTAREEAARADEEATNAKNEAAIAQAVNEFVNEDLLGSAHPSAEPNRDLKVREVLDRASQNLEDRFTDHPLVKARILVTIGNAYFALGEYEGAQKHYEQSRGLNQQEFGTDHPRTLNAMLGVANAINRQGRYKEAEKLHREVLKVRQRVLGSEDPATLGSMHNLATTIKRQDRYEEAEKLYREVLKIQQQVLGPEDPATLRSMHNLAGAMRGRRQFEEAEDLLREVAEITRRVLGDQHPHAISATSSLGTVMSEQGRYKEAEDLYSKALESQQRVLGPEHPATLGTMNNLGETIRRHGRYKEAEDLHRKVLESRQRVLGPEHPATFVSMNNLALAIYGQGRTEEAVELTSRTFEMCRRALGDDHPQTRLTVDSLAIRYTNWCWRLSTVADASKRDPAKAVELAELAIELQPDVANHWSNLGVAQCRAGKWQAAVDALEKADAMTEGGDRVHRMFLAMAYWQHGEEEKARELYAQGAAWIAEHRKDNENQKRFRAEAEELMGISKEERKRMVEEYLARAVDAAAEAQNDKPDETGNETGDQTLKEVEREGQDNAP